MNRRQFVTGVAATAVGAALPVAVETSAWEKATWGRVVLVYNTTNDQLAARPKYDLVWD